MALDRFAQQTAGIQRRAIGRGHNAYLALRNHRRLGNRNAKQVWMYRPEPRRQRAQLDAFDSALLNEGNRVLKIVVGVLGAIGSENSARQHLGSEIPPFFDRNLASINVNEDSTQDDQQRDQDNDHADQQGQHRNKINVIHGKPLIVRSTAFRRKLLRIMQFRLKAVLQTSPPNGNSKNRRKLF